VNTCVFQREKNVLTPSKLITFNFHQEEPQELYSWSLALTGFRATVVLHQS